MTSATDRLRALLDERGVEHVDAEDGHTQHTWWSDGDHEIAASNSGERLAVYNLTPEQAVAATLGPGTCRDVGRYAFVCSECGWASDEPHHALGGFWPKYCPECGRKVVE